MYSWRARGEAAAVTLEARLWWACSRCPSAKRPHEKHAAGYIGKVKLEVLRST
jgi:hypothetical protein